MNTSTALHFSSISLDYLTYIAYLHSNLPLWSRFPLPRKGILDARTSHIIAAMVEILLKPKKRPIYDAMAQSRSAFVGSVLFWSCIWWRVRLAND